VGCSLHLVDSSLFGEGEVKTILLSKPVNSESKTQEGLSQRREVFTFIPVKSGWVQLPSIQIDWWNTNLNQKMTSTLSRKTFDVAADINGDTYSATAVKSPTSEPHTTANKKSEIRDPVLRERDLLIAQTPQDLKRFLQAYAYTHWQLPLSSPLSSLIETAAQKIVGFDQEKATALAQELEGALYGGQIIDLAQLRTQFASLLFRKSSRTIKDQQINTLPELNPS
jgi:hypothetical protein